MLSFFVLFFPCVGAFIPPPPPPPPPPTHTYTHTHFFSFFFFFFTRMHCGGRCAVFRLPPPNPTPHPTPHPSPPLASPSIRLGGSLWTATAVRDFQRFCIWSTKSLAMRIFRQSSLTIMTSKAIFNISLVLPFIISQVYIYTYICNLAFASLCRFPEWQAKTITHIFREPFHVTERVIIFWPFSFLQYRYFISDLLLIVCVTTTDLLRWLRLRPEQRLVWLVVLWCYLPPGRYTTSVTI